MLDEQLEPRFWHVRNQVVRTRPNSPTYRLPAAVASYCCRLTQSARPRRKPHSQPSPTRQTPYFCRFARAAARSARSALASCWRYESATMWTMSAKQASHSGAALATKAKPKRKETTSDNSGGCVHVNLTDGAACSPSGCSVSIQRPTPSGAQAKPRHTTGLVATTLGPNRSGSNPRPRRPARDGPALQAHRGRSPMAPADR